MSKRYRWLLVGMVVLLAAIVLTFLLVDPIIVDSADNGDPPDDPTIAAFAKAGCAGCHTIPGVPNAVGLVGPDLSAIGLEAGERVPGLDAEGYIRESILDPNAFIAPDCPSGECPADVMLPNFSERLTDDEISLIVDYLLTLTGEGVTSAVPYELVPIEIVRPPETEVTPFAEPPNTYDDAQVLLGKFLFFDPRLSGDANISCATCHQPEHAWSNELALSVGYTGNQYFRNAPTIMNTVFQEYLYWDGRMDGQDMPTLVT